MKFLIFFSHIIFSITLFSANISIVNKFPHDIIQLLRKHQVWQTIPYSKLPVGNSYQVVPDLQKKWALRQLDTSNYGLFEKTNLSLRETSSGAIEWYSEKVNLSLPIRIEQFVLMKDSGEKLNFKLIGNDSFVVTRSNGSLNIIFTPEKPGKLLTKPVKDLANIHIATAPFGFSGDTLKNAGIVKQPTAYLHHSLSSSKEIWISPVFPSKYYPTLIRSLRKWNDALGGELFQTHLKVGEINQDECLANNALCIIWFGSENIPWSGMMALTSLSFDPETGNIIGGILSINNLAPQELTITPPDIIERAASKNPGIKWVAETFINGDAFTHYLHPFAEHSLEYFLLHEIGHFNGLVHNFAGSRNGSFNNPTESIMDYFAFPVNFKANRIGKFDKAMLDLVYKGTLPENNKYYFCGDNQLYGKNWTPNCDQRDLGDTLKWYEYLAEYSSKSGLFQTMPFVVDFTTKNVPLIELIADYFETSSGDRAKRIVCKHYNTDIKNYLDQRKIKLECD